MHLQAPTDGGERAAQPAHVVIGGGAREHGVQLHAREAKVGLTDFLANQVDVEIARALRVRRVEQPRDVRLELVRRLALALRQQRTPR